MRSFWWVRRARARAHRRSGWPSGWTCRTSPPATCSAPTCKQETPLGVEAKRYMDAGDLVPDEVTVEMVRARLGRDDAAKGFLLDGFPRTISQAESLDEMLAERGEDLDAVVEFQVPEEELVAAAAGRGRADDTEDVIRRRQQVYRDETAPLLEHYRDKLVRSTPSARSRRSPTGSPTRCATAVTGTRDGVPRAASAGARALAWPRHRAEEPRRARRDARRRRPRGAARSPRSPTLAKPGVSTAELDALAEQTIRDGGAVPSFLGYHGYPASICASVNEQIVHGIPAADAGARRRRPDLGRLRGDPRGLARRRRGHASPSATVAPADLALSAACEAALHAGIAAVRARRAAHRHLARRAAAVAAAGERDGADVRHRRGVRRARHRHVDAHGPVPAQPRRPRPRAAAASSGMALAVEPMLTGGRPGDPRARRRLDGRHGRRQPGGALGALGGDHATTARGSSPSR